MWICIIWSIKCRSFGSGQKGGGEVHSGQEFLAQLWFDEFMKFWQWKQATPKNVIWK